MKIFLIISVFAQLAYCQILAPMSARSFSLGQSSLMSTTDIVDIYSNPSSIAKLRKITTSIGYSFQGDDIHAFDLGLSVPTNYGIFGFSYYRSTIGGLQRTNIFGENESTFSFNNNYYTFGYTRKIFQKLEIGINSNLLSVEIDDYESGISNMGIDISFQYYFKLNDKNFREIILGLLFKNIVKPYIKYPTSKDYLPLDIILMIENNLSFREHLLKLILNFDYYVREEVKDKYAIFKYKDIYGYHIAMEYGFRSLLFLRIGYFSDSISVVKNNDEFGDYLLSYGIGIKLNTIYLSYGYGNYGKRYTSIEPFHKISLSIGILKNITK